jgi:ferredoxin-NADP reductase
MQEPNIIEYDPPVTLTFIKKRHEYDDVHSFFFKPSQELPFLSGQNARIILPGLPDGENRRSLSFASTPQDGHIMFSTHVRSGSAFKKTLSELKEGDTVDLVKLKGHMTLPKHEKTPVVLIAGGIGITPFRSMLLDIHERNLPTEAVLFHVSKSGYLYEEDFKGLPFEQHRIRRPEIEKTLASVTEKYPDAEYYIAGPPGFSEALRGLLKEKQIEESHIHATDFSGYEERDD